MPRALGGVHSARPAADNRRLMLREPDPTAWLPSAAAPPALPGTLAYWLPEARLDALRRQLGEPGERALAPAEVAEAVALAWHLRQRDTAAAGRWEAGLRGAVAALPDDPQRQALGLRLDLVAGERLWLDGQLDAARDRADALLPAVGNAPSLLRHDALVLRSRELWDRGRFAEYTALLREAERVAQACGDEVRRRTARIAQAMADLYRDSDAGDLRQRWAADLQVGDDADPALRGAAHYLQAHLAMRSRDTRAALAHTLEASALLETAGNLRQAAAAEISVSVYLAYLGDPTAALEQGLATVAKLRPLGWPMPLGLALANLGAYYANLGRGPEALAALAEAEAVLRDHPQSFEAVSVLAERARTQMLVGDPAQALADAQRVQALVADGRFRVHANRAITAQAQALAALGEPAAGLALLEGLLLWPDGDLVLPRRAAVLEAAADIHRQHPHLPGPPAMVAPTAEIHYLQARIDLTRDGEAELLPHDALEKLSQAWRALGEWERALACSQQALAAWRRQHDQQAAQRAVVMEVRLRTAQAQAEARRQGLAAEAASRRADALAELSTLLRRLSDVGRELTTHRSLDELAPLLKARLQALMPVETLMLLEMDADERGLHLVAGRIEGEAVHDVQVRLDDAGSLVARCAREGRLLRMPEDGQAVLRLSGTPRMQAALFVPLRVDDRLVGVLTLQSIRPDAYGERELEMMGPLGNYVAIALDNARGWRELQVSVRALEAAQADLEAQKAALETASLTDSLTGLWNRRYVQQRVLAQAQRLAASPGRPAAPQEPAMLVLLVDVDHFKQVNDRHGHAAGDAVLQQMAERLRALTRPEDHVVRWGGEEFLLVAIAAERSQPLALAERVREAVAAQPFDLGDGRTITLTCSVGVAVYPPEPGSAADGRPDWDHAIAAADAALLSAKRSGRNRCVLT